MQPTAPVLLNVLRVCDLPDAIGLVGPRPVTVTGIRDPCLEKTAALWDVEALTSRPLAVLIVPEKVVAANPGTPTGYRIVREEIDTTIRFPEPLALHVYELEREPGERVRGNDVRR